MPDTPPTITPPALAATAPAAVTTILVKLRDDLDYYDHTTYGSEAVRTARAIVTGVRDLLSALHLRTYPPEPDADAPGEQAVITVYGVDLSIRRRDDGVFVHIDSTDMPPDLLPLIGVFNNGGENIYAEPDIDADSVPISDR
jgi:hypothetical protein